VSTEIPRALDKGELKHERLLAADGIRARVSFDDELDTFVEISVLPFWIAGADRPKIDELLRELSTRIGELRI
jgi:hypothetical protein